MYGIPQEEGEYRMKKEKDPRARIIDLAMGCKDNDSFARKWTKK